MEARRSILALLLLVACGPPFPLSVEKKPPSRVADSGYRDDVEELTPDAGEEEADAGTVLRIDSATFGDGSVVKTKTVPPDTKLAVRVVGQGLPTSAGAVSVVGFPATPTIAAASTSQLLILNVSLASVPFGSYEFRVKVLTELSPPLVMTVVEGQPPEPPGDGYISGSAKLEVGGLPASPVRDKEVIFCLFNSTNENFVEVRHRSGGVKPNGDPYVGGFQVKGALEPTTYCGTDESHVFRNQPVGDGTWSVKWSDDGQLSVSSPKGTQAIQLGQLGARPSFDRLRRGTCKPETGIIRDSSPARVTVTDFSGTVGAAIFKCP